MESFVLKVLIVMPFLLASSSADNFYQNVSITYGAFLVHIDKSGQVLSLSLTKSSGSGFKSKNEYLYSRLDMQLKLVPRNSVGTVTTFYLSSKGSSHDEIDFEFLGNSSGQPYTVSTNIYVNGSGNREQQFRLWFDPTKHFHTYTIIWNSQRIIQMVDKIPIRVFNNYVAYKVPYPTSQSMRMYASLWNVDDWATQGGRVKTNWSKAPFTATYANLNISGCVVKGTWNSCKGAGQKPAWQTMGLDAKERKLLRWVQMYRMIYNYCDDSKRFPQGLPKECAYKK